MPKQTSNTVLKTTIVGIIILSISACTTLNKKDSSDLAQTTVNSVNFDKYQGTWYEIARLPMYFQRKCVSAVTATYRKRADAKIEVINKCTDKKGEQMIANGVASVDKKYPNAGNSRLLVSFLPESLQWLPVGKGGYWILALDIDEQTGNYDHVMVGSPNRKYLWILSRTPDMSDVDYQRYVNIAKSQGYVLDKLIRTTHTQK